MSVSAQCTADGAARRAGLGRFVRAVAQAELTDGAPVRDRLGRWLERASEVDAAEEVGDDVLAALHTVVFAVLVVAAQSVLVVGGRCYGG